MFSVHFFLSASHKWCNSTWRNCGLEKLKHSVYHRVIYNGHTKVPSSGLLIGSQQYNIK